MIPVVHGHGFARSATTRAPFLFSYDIASPKVARAVRRVLRPWRRDGQLSVHEVVVTPPQAGALAEELAAIMDAATDRLLIARLSRRGEGPVFALSTGRRAVPLAVRPGPPPAGAAGGWYLLAYDVCEPRRLRRVQQATGRQAAFLQRSVYLFGGSGTALAALLRSVAALLVVGLDDLRVYSLAGPADLWFPCGAAPPLVGPGAAWVPAAVGWSPPGAPGHDPVAAGGGDG